MTRAYFAMLVAISILPVSHRCGAIMLPSKLQKVWHRNVSIM
jgi:hypothetical protein